MFEPSFKPASPSRRFLPPSPLYSPNIVSFTNAPGSVASLALGCVLCRPCWRARSSQGSGLPSPRLATRRPASFRTADRDSSSVLYLGRLAVLAADGLNSSTSRALEAGAGVSCGLGLIVLCCAWDAILGTGRSDRPAARCHHLRIGSLVSFSVRSSGRHPRLSFRFSPSF